MEEPSSGSDFIWESRESTDKKIDIIYIPLNSNWISALSIRHKKVLSCPVADLQNFLFPSLGEEQLHLKAAGLCLSSWSGTESLPQSLNLLTSLKQRNASQQLEMKILINYCKVVNRQKFLPVPCGLKVCAPAERGQVTGTGWSQQGIFSAASWVCLRINDSAFIFLLV